MRHAGKSAGGTGRWEFRMRFPALPPPALRARPLRRRTQRRRAPLSPRPSRGGCGATAPPASRLGPGGHLGPAVRPRRGDPCWPCWAAPAAPAPGVERGPTCGGAASGRAPAPSVRRRSRLRAARASARRRRRPALPRAAPRGRSTSPSRRQTPPWPGQSPERPPLAGPPPALSCQPGPVRPVTPALRGLHVGFSLRSRERVCASGRVNETDD